MTGTRRVMELAAGRDSRLPRLSSDGSLRPLMARSREQRLRRNQLQPPWAVHLTAGDARTSTFSRAWTIYRPKWPT